MARDTRYVHTNLVANDWRGLASFYQRVLGCEVVPPERHFSGPTLAAGTGLPGARIDGVRGPIGLGVPGGGLERGRPGGWRRSHADDRRRAAGHLVLPYGPGRQHHRVAVVEVAWGAVEQADAADEAWGGTRTAR
jgi:hypothetical protein